MPETLISKAFIYKFLKFLCFLGRSLGLEYRHLFSCCWFFFFLFFFLILSGVQELSTAATPWTYTLT